MQRTTVRAYNDAEPPETQEAKYPKFRCLMRKRAAPGQPSKRELIAKAAKENREKQNEIIEQRRREKLEKKKAKKIKVLRAETPAAPTPPPRIGNAKGPTIPKLKPRSRALDWGVGDNAGHATTRTPIKPSGLEDVAMNPEQAERDVEELDSLPGSGGHPWHQVDEVPNGLPHEYSHQRPFITRHAPSPADAIKLSDEHKHLINIMARYGASRREIAHELNLTERELLAIAMRDEEVIKEMQVGREYADARVEESLYRRATGYTYDSEKIFHVLGRIIRVPVVEHVPPDVEACKFWLNRRSDKWRAKEGPDVGDDTPVGKVTIVVEDGRKTPRKLEDSDA